MDRRKRTARTVALMSLFSMTDTQENVPVASFDGDGSDLISLNVDIEPVQDLNGYDNPWPAGGGKNLISPILSPAYEPILSNVTESEASEKSITLTSGSYLYACKRIFYELPAGTYTFKYLATSSDSYTPIVSIYNKATGSLIMGGNSIAPSTPGTITLAETTTLDIRLFVTTSTAAVRTVTFSDIQLESGSSIAAWSPYSNICPISGWTGANIHVSPTTDAADGTTYSITFPTSAGTVYGGTLDVTTGKLTVTDGYIASYNGETLPSTWISDRDVYAVGANPTTGAEVVYKLATSIVYDLTPTEINTLIGTNNIWADTGEIKYIEYNV